MSSFKKKSLSRYGLAMVMIAGAGLIAATSQSGAEVNQPLQDHDCWLEMVRVCNWNYYPPCWEKPDGSTCFSCPYTMYGSAHCVERPGYVCKPTSDLPFDCGSKLRGMCVGGNCYGEIVTNMPCSILQCTKVSP